MNRAIRFTYVAGALAVAVLVSPPALAAQDTRAASGSADLATGRIVGRVVDAQTGQGIVGVMVNVPEARVGAVTGVDGRYLLARVPAGTCTIRVQSLGYATKVITGIAVPDGGAVEQNVTLETQAVELAAIEVSAGAERGSVNRALDQQRTSTAIVNAVTAEQISRSPDGDAAAAMQRVSGVTVQDGKFVHVRGLGERYTTTSLNGARIPSPEPERRIVPLDLFPAGLLQTITTSKTFTPDQPGDFSGGQVDIKTREFPAERQLTYSLSFGYNSLATGKQLPFAPDNSLFGFAGSGRSLPQSVRNAGTFEPPPTQAEMNGMLRDFRNAWSSQDKSARPNGSFGFSLGGNDKLLGRQIAYLVSGTYSRSDEVKSNEVRAQAQAGPQGSTIEIDRFQGITGRNSVLWGGLLNLSTLVGTRTRLAVNGTYNRTADNEARSELGTSENLGELPLQIERLRFVERAVYSGQLKGEHEFSARHRADWSVTASGVERNEPDRSEIVYAIQTDPATNLPLPAAWFSGSNEGAVRTFGELSETALEAAANYRLAFGDVLSQQYVKLGALVRTTDRSADTRAFSISTNQLSRSDRELRAEEIFDGRFAAGTHNILRITPLSQGGSYTADDRLLAGFAMLDLALGERVRLIGGARVERSKVRVVAQPTLGQPYVSEPSYTDVLPSLALNLRLSDRQNVRLSASQTLARPEYRELAGVAYRDVLGGDNVVGNPELVRTLIQNADLRWEWYPDAGEVVSLGVFAKHFDDPIERIYLATSGTRVIKYVNAEAAQNYGVEVELRKGLGTFSQSLNPLSVFANATLMKSDIRIGDTGEASTTNDQRAMVGQAPYVVNAGLTWATETGASSATVLYNVVGRRIVSAGEVPLPDVYEQARNVVDLSLRLAISGSLSAKLDARNLLDEPYEIRQGTVVRESYRAGRTFSFGLSWKR
jgi:hypothetical protein